MSEAGKAIRLNRILRRPRGRALIIAFDHALMLGPIPGTENPSAMLARFVEGRVDGVLVSLGMLREHFRPLLAPGAPAVIARIDWTDVWRRPGASQSGEFRSCLVGRVEDALRLGADAVLTYMFIGSGSPEVEAAEVAKNAQVSRECERLGVPHIIESMARGQEVANPGDVEWIRLHTRMAAELGADLIKTDYPGDEESLRSVVAGCPAPILLAGGPKQSSDDQVLKMIGDIVSAGAAGVIFGRNVFQAEDMNSFLAQASALLTPDPSQP
ncbi:MAG: class I fructose-bisphosphate aldolase [Bryobacteraceae bacterium]